MQFWVFPSPYVSLAPWFDLLGYGVVPRKSPEWAAKAFAVFPLGCVVHCCSEPSNSVLWTRIDLCTASGVLDKRFMARCMQWSNMRKYRKVHVLKYRKVLKQFCAKKQQQKNRKMRKMRKTRKKILGSEKKAEIYRNAENFHVCLMNVWHAPATITPVINANVKFNSNSNLNPNNNPYPTLSLPSL